MQPVGNRSYFRCDHCGTFEFPATNADGIAAVGPVSELPCPICQVPLAAGAIEGHPVHFCTTCRGFLCSNADFGEIVPKRRNQFADEPTKPRAFDSKELQRRLKCPQCRKGMDTHPYGGGGNAVVDTCHRCRLIWLDAQELETIARYRPAVRNLGPSSDLLAGRPMLPDPQPGWRRTDRANDTSPAIGDWIGGLLSMLGRW
jgi:Zn-finger nucleic acid-binding protein